jgi:hypothetical protein
MDYRGTGDGFSVIDGANNHYSYIGFNFTLFYRLLSGSAPAGIAADGGTAPAMPFLDQNYPNPFNPTTTIGYALPWRSRVTLSVYTALGQIVTTIVNGEEQAGYHEVRFDGIGLASGVYFYRLQAGSFVKTMKALILR